MSSSTSSTPGSPGTAPDFIIRAEAPADATSIDGVVRRAFGPGMNARAASALREGVPHAAEHALVAVHDEKLVGTVRFTPFHWGETLALMLGPLAVDPSEKSRGIGRSLMQQSMGALRSQPPEGIGLVMLVGDLDYYAPFGFKSVPPGRIILPRPADPARTLVCELKTGALEGVSGTARNAF